MNADIQILIGYYFLMLASQPAVPAVGVPEGPDRDGLKDSPDVTAGPLDQHHVLERFVETHCTHRTSHYNCRHFMSFYIMSFQRCAKEVERDAITP